MKPTYKGFEAKKSGGFVELPPKGVYVAEIKDAREVDGFNGRKQLEVILDVDEGEYKGRYVEQWNDAKERFDTANYKGTFRLTPPVDGDEDWRRRAFESNLWCVQQSNPGYEWDWDEKKLKGKKVGINIRNRLYTYNGQERSTTEICQFETVDDVRNGKAKPKQDRDQRRHDADSTDGQEFTDVSKTVDVPWA